MRKAVKRGTHNMELVKHIFIRLYIIFIFTLFYFTLGLSLCVFLPLYKAAFAPNVPYKDLSFTVIWKHLFKSLWLLLTEKNFIGMYSVKLYAPPVLYNDTTVCIKDSWKGGKYNCDACENICCRQINCPLLRDKRCLGYGSLFYRYFSCGRYPVNQTQIDIYNCPKWEMLK